MSLTANKDAEFFDLVFSKKLEYVRSIGTLLMAYDGVLNSETISRLESDIEGKILDMDRKRSRASCRSGRSFK